VAYGAIRLNTWTGTGVAPPTTTNAQSQEIKGTAIAHLHADTCANNGGGHWEHTDLFNVEDYNELWFHMRGISTADIAATGEAGWIGTGMAEFDMNRTETTVKSIVVHKTDDKSVCCDLQLTTTETPDCEFGIEGPDEYPEYPDERTVDTPPEEEELAWSQSDAGMYCDEWVSLNAGTVSGYGVISFNGGHTYGAVRLDEWTNTLYTPTTARDESGFAVAHLHDDTCANGGGGHYKDNTNLGTFESNELWFYLRGHYDYLTDTQINTMGWYGAGMADFSIDPTSDTVKSIVVHDPNNSSKSVCCDLKRTAYPEATCSADPNAGSASVVGASAAISLGLACVSAALSWK